MGVSWYLVQLKTAKAWGVTPDVFFGKDKKTQAEMMATVDVINTIEAYYTEWAIQDSQGQSGSDTTKRQR